MDIVNFIYHGVEKDQGKDTKITDLFEKEETIDVLPENTKLVTFLNELRGKYNKAGPSYGQLKREETSNFTKSLDLYIQEGIDFVSFSKKTFKLLCDEIEGTSTANGGVILFLEYISLSKKYILIVSLKEKDVMILNRDDRSLQAILSLDLEKIHEAARITIEDYLINNQPYLSFIKGPKNRKVTDYFRKALNCSDFTDSVKFTEDLIELYRSFAKTKNYTKEKIYADEKKIFDLFEQIRTDKKDGNGDGLVQLTVISAIVDVSNPLEFLDFIQASEDHRIPHDFEPNKTVYSRLQRFRGKDGDAVFSFSREDYNTGKVDFFDSDDDSETIVTFKIKNPTTRKELKEFKAEDEQTTNR